jgi:CBS domain-containing protein
MTAIEKFVSITPTLASNTSIFDTIDYLIINNCDHAFVQHEEEMAGIVSAEHSLENYKSQNMSGATIREYMEPLLAIKGYEPKSRALEMMLEHDVEFIAVTNPNGVLSGVAVLKDLAGPVPIR